MAEEKKVNPLLIALDESVNLEEKYTNLKQQAEEAIELSINNKSAIRTIIKNTERSMALLQHQAKVEEEQDIVYRSKRFMKSLRQITYMTGNDRY